VKKSASFIFQILCLGGLLHRIDECRVNDQSQSG